LNYVQDPDYPLISYFVKPDKAYAVFALIGFIGFSLVTNYILAG